MVFVKCIMLYFVGKVKHMNSVWKEVLIDTEWRASNMFVSTVTDVERRSALHVSTDPTVQRLSWTAKGHSQARSRDILCLQN
jgi:hypothetical protein